MINMTTGSLNRLELKYYRVSITGAVDNLSVEQYALENGTPTNNPPYGDALPTTDAQSKAIEYTNMRYEEVIRQVSERIQPLFVSSIVTTSRTATAPAASIAFTLPYDRPECLVTYDELNSNALIGYGVNGSTAEAAIKRMVARALIIDVVQNRYTYLPEATVGTTPYGPGMLALTATKLYANLTTAESNITVTEITNLDN